MFKKKLQLSLDEDDDRYSPTHEDNEEKDLGKSDEKQNAIIQFEEFNYSIKSFQQIIQNILMNLKCNHYVFLSNKAIQPQNDDIACFEPPAPNKHTNNRQFIFPTNSSLTNNNRKEIVKEKDVKKDLEYSRLIEQIQELTKELKFVKEENHQLKESNKKLQEQLSNDRQQKLNLNHELSQYRVQNSSNKLFSNIFPEHSEKCSLQKKEKLFQQRKYFDSPSKWQFQTLNASPNRNCLTSLNNFIKPKTNPVQIRNITNLLDSSRPSVNQSLSSLKNLLKNSFTNPLSVKKNAQQSCEYFKINLNYRSDK